MQTSFGFDAATAAFNLAAYSSQIVGSEAYHAFRIAPSYETARALTKAIWNAIFDSLEAFAGVAVNSSTGKDSTLMVDTIVEVLTERVAAGLPVNRVLICTSNTLTEFPEMEARMIAETKALNDFASATGIPLTAELTEPPPQHNLLVEVIGRGKALPMLAKGAGATRDGRHWCMDRVKAGPIDAITDRILRSFPFYIKAIGQRVDESDARAQNIAEYSASLPFGLTYVRTAPRPGAETVIDARTLGALPIRHWTDDMMADWFVQGKAPWRPDSMKEIRSIYHRAATKDEIAGECGLRITKEGFTTSTCSDLSGSRLGCWMCYVSRNRSLENFAAVDQRYESLWEAYSYIYAQHERTMRRGKLRDRLGFDENTLFPKSFTFRERYLMLMWVLRAQRLSGFELLSETSLNEIRSAWRREGVWLVDPLEAFDDVDQWIATGHMHLGYENLAYDAERLVSRFSEGLPAGAYQHLLGSLRGKFEPLSLGHFAGLAGVATPLVPTLLAYVFGDINNGDLVLTMVTDIPSVLGTKLHRKFLNGTHLGRWRCLGVRAPNAFEMTASDGRVLFYRISLKETKAKLRAAVANEDSDEIGRLASLLDQSLLTTAGCGDRFCLDEAVQDADWRQRCAGKMPPDIFPSFMQDATAFMLVSEELTDTAKAGRRSLLNEAQHLLPLIELDTDEGKTARTLFERIAKRCYDLDAMAPVFEEYLGLWRKLIWYFKKGYANAAVVDRLFYLIQMDAIAEPGETDPDWQAFTTQLLTKPSSRVAA